MNTDEILKELAAVERPLNEMQERLWQILVKADGAYITTNKLALEARVLRRHIGFHIHEIRRIKGSFAILSKRFLGYRFYKEQS